MSLENTPRTDEEELEVSQNSPQSVSSNESSISGEPKEGRIILDLSCCVSTWCSDD